MAHEPRPASDRYARNVGELERWVSGIGGGMLAAAGIARRSVGGVLMAFAGGLLLDRALTGHSRSYAALGVSTAERRAGPREPRPPRRTGEPEDVVEEASGESFPASDSPAWTPDSHIGAPPRREKEARADEDGRAE